MAPFSVSLSLSVLVLQEDPGKDSQGRARDGTLAAAKAMQVNIRRVTPPSGQKF